MKSTIGMAVTYVILHLTLLRWLESAITNQVLYYVILAVIYFLVAIIWYLIGKKLFRKK
jgi:uncharacterized membrane protein